MKKTIVFILLITASLLTPFSLAYITPSTTAQPPNELDEDRFETPYDGGFTYVVDYWVYVSGEPVFGGGYDEHLYMYIDTDVIGGLDINQYGLSPFPPYEPLLLDTYTLLDFNTLGEALITDDGILPISVVNFDEGASWIEMTFYSNPSESDSLATWLINVKDSIYISGAISYWGNQSIIAEIEYAYNLGFTEGSATATTDAYLEGLSDGADNIHAYYQDLFDGEGCELLTDNNDDGYLDCSYNQGLSDGGVVGQSWIVVFFSLFDTIFSIELLPGLTIGIILGIVIIPPIVIGVIKWIT